MNIKSVNIVISLLMKASVISGFLCSLVYANEPFSAGDCLIEPSDTVALSSPVPGLLADILVRRGDPVRKGQLVARVHSKVEQARVDLAQAKLEFGQRKVQRNQELVEQELISMHELDEMQTENQLAELELREANENLLLRKIYSPIDGVVVQTYLSPGEYMGADPVMQLVSINPLHVEVILPVMAFGKIQEGQTGWVLPEAPVGGRHQATVDIVDQVIDAASGTFGVRLLLPNPKNVLPAGLRCQIQF